MESVTEESDSAFVLAANYNGVWSVLSGKKKAKAAGERQGKVSERWRIGHTDGVRATRGSEVARALDVSSRKFDSPEGFAGQVTSMERDPASLSSALSLPLVVKTAFSPNLPSHFLENARARPYTPRLLSRSDTSLSLHFVRGYASSPALSFPLLLAASPIRMCAYIVTYMWHLSLLALRRSGKYRRHPFQDTKSDVRKPVYCSFTPLFLYIKNVSNFLRFPLFINLLIKLKFICKKYILIKIY